MEATRPIVTANEPDSIANRESKGVSDILLSLPEAPTGGISDRYTSSSAMATTENVSPADNFDLDEAMAFLESLDNDEYKSKNTVIPTAEESHQAQFSSPLVALQRSAEDTRTEPASTSAAASKRHLRATSLGSLYVFGDSDVSLGSSTNSSANLSYPSLEESRPRSLSVNQIQQRKNMQGEGEEDVPLRQLPLNEDRRHEADHTKAHVVDAQHLVYNSMQLLGERSRELGRQQEAAAAAQRQYQQNMELSLQDQMRPGVQPSILLERNQSEESRRQQLLQQLDKERQRAEKLQNYKVEQERIRQKKQKEEEKEEEGQQQHSRIPVRGLLVSSNVVAALQSRTLPVGSPQYRGNYICCGSCQLWIKGPIDAMLIVCPSCESLNKCLPRPLSDERSEERRGPTSDSDMLSALTEFVESTVSQSVDFLDRSLSNLWGGHEEDTTGGDQLDIPLRDVSEHQVARDSRVAHEIDTDRQNTGQYSVADSLSLNLFGVPSSRAPGSGQYTPR